MDLPGNNRYQLLFTDDESPPISMPIKTKKKSVSDANKLPKSQMLLCSGKENKVKINVIKNYTDFIDSKDNKNKTIITCKYANKDNFLESKSETFNRGYKNREAYDDRNSRQYRDRGFSKHRNSERLGKRDFDRQSGSDKTGVKAIEKRNGAGSHNWGSLKQDIRDIQKNIPYMERNIDNGAYHTESFYQPDETNVEEEFKVMTLDEWKALRQNRSKPQYNIRKAGEGEDASQWKKMVVLNKKNEKFCEDDYEFDHSLYPQRVGRLQRLTDIKFSFSDARRAHGRGRNKPIRNDHKSDKSFKKSNISDQQGCPKPIMLRMNDESQFPTLT